MWLRYVLCKNPGASDYTDYNKKHVNFTLKRGHNALVVTDFFLLIQYSDFGIISVQREQDEQKYNPYNHVGSGCTAVVTRSPQQPVLKTCSFAIRRQDRKRVAATTGGNKERKSFCISRET